MMANQKNHKWPVPQMSWTRIKKNKTKHTQVTAGRGLHLTGQVIFLIYYTIQVLATYSLPMHTPSVSMFGSKWKWVRAIPAQSPTMRLMNPRQLWFVFYSWASNFISADEFRLRSGRSSSVTLQQPHHENSFPTLSNNYRELQLGSTKSRAPKPHFFVCSCADSSLFFPQVFHAALFTVVKHKQRCFFTFDRWLFIACISEVSEASPRIERAEHKQVKRSTILIFKERTKEPPRNENFKTFVVLFPKPSILWSGFHLHLILPLPNQRGTKSIFLISGLPSVTIRRNSTVLETFTRILSTAQLILSSLFFHWRRSLRMKKKNSGLLLNTEICAVFT